MEFKATGTWVALVDPREPVKKESVIELLDETREYMKKDTSDLNTNTFEVHSVGAEVRNKKIRPGIKVLVDPRIPLGAVEDDNGVLNLVIQENQIMMINAG